MSARLTLLAGAAGIALASPSAAHAADEPWTLHDAMGAPDNLRISGSARIRYEALSNQFRPGLDENDDLISLRASLFAEYDAGPVRLGAELIDSRAYDADAGGAVGTGEVNALELVQAYVGADLGDALGEGSTAKLDLGRFTMDLGSRRLVGRNNFRNTTNAFTGARFDWRGGGREQVTLFYTLPHTRLPSDKESILDNEVEWDRETFDLSFWGAFVNLPGIAGRANLDLYFFGLDEDDSPSVATRNRELYTTGLRLFREPQAGQFDFEVEAAYQFGNARSGTGATAPRQDVSAWTLHAEAGYQFAGAWAPRLSFEYDHATGDEADGGYGRFDSLYGPRRPDWGPTGIYGPLGRANIRSPGVRLEAKPSSRWDGFLAYRAAWLDSRTDAFAFTGVRDPGGDAGRFAGHQIEGRVRYWIVPGLLRLDTGGAVLFHGRFLESAANANDYGDTVYGYADLTLTF
jgi:alginate export protein